MHYEVRIANWSITRTLITYSPVKKTPCVECTGFPLHSKKAITRTAGFEPARAEPNAFRVHLRNHLDTSATVPLQLLEESSKEQEE